MKTIIRFTSLLFIILLFSNSSCTKRKPPTGDHTFSCYIDGELFIPKGSSNLTSTGPIGDGLSLLKYDDFFHASASDYNKYTIMFNIVNWEEGIFQLSNSNGDFYNDSTNHAMCKKNDIWYLSKENSGNVTFTKADIDGDTMGTFEFTLYNENDPTDVIHVTEGRFDD